jgi:hypothetical protein
MNPAMMEVMAQTRMTGMRQAAADRSRRTWQPVTGGGTCPSRAPTGPTRPAEARRAVGWFLISVGLRLALPRTAPAR